MIAIPDERGRYFTSRTPLCFATGYFFRADFEAVFGASDFGAGLLSGAFDSVAGFEALFDPDWPSDLPVPDAVVSDGLESPVFDSPVFESPVLESPVFESPVFDSPPLESLEAPSAFLAESLYPSER